MLLQGRCKEEEAEVGIGRFMPYFQGKKYDVSPINASTFALWQFQLTLAHQGRADLLVCHVRRRGSAALPDDCVSVLL
jgi:hypothetical protein